MMLFYSCLQLGTTSQTTTQHNKRLSLDPRDPRILVIQPLTEETSVSCSVDSTTECHTTQKQTITCTDHARQPPTSEGTTDTSQEPRQPPTSEGTTDTSTEPQRNTTQPDTEITVANDNREPLSETTAEKENKNPDTKMIFVKPPPAKSRSTLGSKNSLNPMVPGSFDFSSTNNISLTATRPPDTASSTKGAATKGMKNIRDAEKRTLLSKLDPQASHAAAVTAPSDNNMQPDSKKQRLNTGQTVATNNAQNNSDDMQREMTTQSNSSTHPTNQQKDPLPHSCFAPVLEVADQQQLQSHFSSSPDPWGELSAIPQLPTKTMQLFSSQRTRRRKTVLFQVYCSNKEHKIRESRNNRISDVVSTTTREHVMTIPGTFHCIVQFKGSYYILPPNLQVGLMLSRFNTSFNHENPLPLTVVFKEDNVNKVHVYFWTSKLWQWDGK